MLTGEAEEKKEKISAGQTLLRSSLFLLYSTLEQAVYVAVSMFKSIFPALLIWASLSLYGVEQSWFAVWMAVGSLVTLVNQLKR